VSEAIPTETPGIEFKIGKIVDRSSFQSATIVKPSSPDEAPSPIISIDGQRSSPRKAKGFPMQRFLDKWGLWFALVVIGSIISYGLIAGLLKEDEDANKGAKKTATAK
jgi:hypothetical protein